ncbi:hypothetical protein [Corynebacterium mustelae]|nr:hypothetical protein [Corynebacterium mustelae]
MAHPNSQLPHTHELDRVEAIRSAVEAVNAPTRPSQHKQDVEFLCENLAITDQEILSHAEELGSMIGTGDSALINAIGARYCALVGLTQLCDSALGALYAPTVKPKIIVLQGLLKRHDVGAAELTVLEPRLHELACANNKQVAKLAAELLTRGGIPVAATETITPTLTWEPAPPLWQPPRFERGGDTVDDVVAELQKTTWSYHVNNFVPDIHLERFVAGLAECAQHDRGAAEKILARSLYATHRMQHAYGLDPVDARNRSIFFQLGSIPCVLSQPSYVDFRITPDDFLERLACYRDRGLPVIEADLFLALCRLDMRSHDVEAFVHKAESFGLEVTTFTGEKYPESAATIIAGYLLQPVRETDISVGTWTTDNKTYLWVDEFPVTKVLRAIPRSADAPYFSFRSAQAFPLIGDKMFLDFAASHHRGIKGKPLGAAAQQVALRSQPLTPGLAINLITAPRFNKDGKAQGLDQAIRLAWQRGLLAPGVPDISLMGWEEKVSSFHGVAEVFRELAEDGMLALVWPIINDALTIAAAAQRPHKGAAELAELTRELLPSVIRAVDSGAADPSVLELPGIRACAAKSGSSRLVVAAQAVDKLLPKRGETQPPGIDFDLAWPHGVGVGSTQPDHATVGLHQGHFDKDWFTSRVYATICVPNYPDLTFVKSRAFSEDFWVFDAYQGEEKIHWGCCLDYDGSQWTLLPDQEYQWGSTHFDPEKALTNSLVFVVFGFLAESSDADATLKFLRLHLHYNHVRAASVKEVMPKLLKEEFWSPLLIIKVLEKEPAHLPALWPVITESLAHAARCLDDGGPAPKWLNRVLDNALYHGEVLAEATCRGLIPAEEWQALETLATPKKKTAAVAKAQKLRALLA